MKSVRTLLFLLLLLIVADEAMAQDPHFSQFYASPLSLNPALTGAFSGSSRASAIYRDQWRGVLDNPYVSFSGAVDLRFPLNISARHDDAIGIGMMFFSDRVDVVDFNFNQLAFSASLHKALDWGGTQYLTIGLQGGVSQRNLNYENLTFEDQFNGTTGYTFASADFLPENNYAYGDLAVGVTYTYNPARRTLFQVGGAIHHVTRPRVSFYALPEEGPLPDEGEGVNLYRRYSAQVSAEIPLQKSGDVSLLPRMLFATMGPHMELTAGSNIRFAFPSNLNMAIQLGGWIRPVRNTNSAADQWGIDAVAALLGLEISNLFIGISYDINLDDLVDYRQGQTAFELSITYIGSFEEEDVLCPSF